MLGAGIFVFPGLAGGDAGFAAILSFFIGGIIALFTAACTAELATAMPHSGGGYFFISRSFGSFWGTLTGISQWVGLIFACAFYLVSFGEYAVGLLAELEIKWNTGSKVLSFSLTAVLLVINLIGTKKVGRFQNLVVITLTIILALIFSYGLFDFFGIKNKNVVFTELTPSGTISIFTTAALIFTSYLGFVQIANIGAEIKNPSKNLPRSLIGSVLIAMGLYMFIITACISTFPKEELRTFGETATIEVARRMLGEWGAAVVVFAGLLATLSSANASLISASRGVFALSKDKLIHQKASAINERFGTPHIALVLVTVPVATMLVNSKLEVFAEVASILHLIIYAGICISVLKLRATNPIWYIPTFRVPAGTLIAGLGAATCLILVTFMQSTSLLLSCGIILLATVYYFVFVRNRKIVLSTPEQPHIETNLFHPSILIPVDITQETMDLPPAILETIPMSMSSLLILGFKETPEQSDSEQSEQEFGEKGERKLQNIRDQLGETTIDFESKLIFSNKVAEQIKQVIDEEGLEFILSPQPLSDINRLVIPIYDLSQVNKKLNTVLYNILSNQQVEVEVVLFPEMTEQTSNEDQFKKSIQNQLSLVNIRVDHFDVKQIEEVAPKTFIQELSQPGDLVIWLEAESSDREQFLDFILGKMSIDTPSPVLMVLKNTKEAEDKH